MPEQQPRSGSNGWLAPRFALFYSAIFLALGIYLPFWPIWLQTQALSPEQIGIILGISNWVKVVSNPAIGHVVDRDAQVRRALIALSFCSSLTFATFYLTGSFWAVLLVQILSAVATHGIIPLGESEAMATARQGRIDYGRVRLWGSCAFIVGSLSTGLLVERHGGELILWVMVGAMALTTFACVGLPRSVRLEEAGFPQRRQETGSLLRSRRFLLFLACAGLLQGSHAFYYGFSAISWTAAGISAQWVAWLWTIGIVAEIGFFFISRNVALRVGPIGLLIVAALAGLIRWSLLGLTTDLTALVFIQLLHAGTFACAHLGAMHFIAENAPENRRASAQMLYTAMGTGLVLGIMMLLSGQLYEWFGNGGFMAMAGASLLGALLALPLLLANRKEAGR